MAEGVRFEEETTKLGRCITLTIFVRIDTDDRKGHRIRTVIEKAKQSIKK